MASGDTSTATLGATDSADESADEVAGVVGSHSSLVHSEVLCFLQNKSKVLAFDDLVTICGGFYSLCELNAAKNILARLVPSKRIGRPKGTENAKIKSC